MNTEKTNKNQKIIIIFINLIIFGIVNIIFSIKYEQVDDFIIYNLYSGLDGTYNIYGIYIHPIICIILSTLYRIISSINWHSIYLLGMQFICFTLIGYTILKKNSSEIAIVLYTIFASIFYTALLMLIQYTSVAALLILTSFILLIDILETKKPTKASKKVLIFALYTLGIMTRMQSLLIVIPFMAIYLLMYIINYKSKNIEKEQIQKMLKYYAIYVIIAIVVYISNAILYNTNETYKQYMEYNDIRTNLHDLNYVSYEENKEIFDEVGWSKNDHYMFYTFGFGDENIYSKENLEKILNYKIEKDGKYNFKTDISEIKESFISECMNNYTYIIIFFMGIFILSLFNRNKTKYNILIFVTTIALHILFIIINRSMQRVVIPEYILGTALMIYNLKLSSKEKINDGIRNCAIVIFMIAIISGFVGKSYNYDYKLGDYQSTQELINYTNNHKENVYLYTIPSLQFRYLAYSVYQMPPKAAFSNLRSIGGWDMFTGNYYDFKERYNLEGTFLDLLKENVYLVDGDVIWSGRRYDNYKENIVLGIKEHYNIEVKCEEVEQFDNLKIYKVIKEE